MSKVNRERKMVDIQQTGIDFENLTLAETLVRVTELIDRYGAEAFIRLKTEDYGDSYREYMYVYTLESETDEAMAKRIAYEEKYAKQCEERDLENYKRLQAKYGVKG